MWPVLKFYTPCNSSRTAEARDFKFCIRVGLVMTDCPLSGRGQGQVSNFYIVDFRHSKLLVYRCYQRTRRRSACGLHLRRSSSSWLNAQVYYALFWACRTSCTYTDMQQLARIRLTRRVARSVSDSRASCEIIVGGWVVYVFATQCVYVSLADKFSTLGPIYIVHVSEDIQASISSVTKYCTNLDLKLAPWPSF